MVTLCTSAIPTTVQTAVSWKRRSGRENGSVKSVRVLKQGFSMRPAGQPGCQRAPSVLTSPGPAAVKTTTVISMLYMRTSLGLARWRERRMVKSFRARSEHNTSWPSRRDGSPSQPLRNHRNRMKRITEPQPQRRSQHRIITRGEKCDFLI